MSSTAELSDLIVSAQDTFEEVLGWYGLRPYTQLKDRDRCGETGLMDSVGTKSLVTRDAPPPISGDASSVSRGIASAMRDSSSLHSRDSSAEDDDVELDGDHPVDLTCIPPVSSSSCTLGEQGTISDLLKMQWGSHKKLVGIRFLFPPLDEQMSLLEKAKIWVARHDCKYFVDWTETELETVDPVLRPLSVITRDIYKLHMNRSEYCRNVKLKYCLQSEAPWAQRFRENLAKLPTEGGFTGLCQAKIAAAELWRKYSEHYRSHQARHPHLRNRDLRSVVIRTRDGDSKTEHETSASGSCYEALCTDSDALSEDCDRELDGKTVNQDSEMMGMSRNNTTEETEDTCTVAPMEDETAGKGKKEHQGTENSFTVNFLKRQTESDVEEPKSKKTTNEISLSRELESRNFSDFGEKSGNSFHHPLDSNEFSDIINLTKKDRVDVENRRTTPLRQALAMSREAGIKTEASQEPEVKPELRLPLAANSFSYWNMSRLGPLMYQLPLAAAYYANPMNFMESSLSSPVLNHQIYPYANASPNFTSSAATAGIDSLAALMPPKKSAKIRGSSNRGELNTEYRRSERGLSFLFPSFSDHNMSLLDKVQITITRHKNNYFLGWDEDALNKLDPLVRPKMVVTAEIYKEYCHRNAMKYDSNLQFAMESAELWAQEFRKKLSLPASEGGFTSLCEVKLEAGRLWREFSGKYRMHNIVKWQMDLNSNTVPAKRLTVGGAHYSARGGGKLPFRKIPRRQRHKDQRAAIQRGVHTLQRGTHSSLQDGDLHFQHLVSSQNHYGCEQLPKGSECSSSSPLIGSFSEGALPRVGSRSEIPVGELCRMSRSLDNSPSMGGGSSDGSVSNVSVVGDASCSPVSGQFPRVTLTPHRLESTDDFLFSPLPRQMPVADQLSVWLERHSNNYFLGYPKESLSTLHTYLRPQVVVTRNVFQRHIPESMVDILGKIKWMMSSSEEWAVGFCSRVCKAPKDGGFSTFEEALTEALVLWHTNKEREIYLRSPSRSKSVGIDSSEGKHCPPDMHRQTYGNKEPSSNATDEIETELTETALNSSKFSSLHDDGASEKKSDSSRVKPRSLVIRDNGALFEEDRSVSNGACSPSPLSEFRPESMVQLLWNLRHTLNVLCKDSPVESWEQRLVPFLPILKRVIGSGYTVPASNTLCMVDLILAALHQRIEEVFSNSLSDKL